jgi:hypothetical protein
MGLWDRRNDATMAMLMKKTKALTLALAGSALLAAGCGGRTSRTLYDANGNAVPRQQWKNADGTWKQLYDANGNLVSQNEVQQAYSTSSTSSSTHRTYASSGGWFFGPSWGGGSSWGSSSRGSPTVSGGSVSRGGFGSTGGGMSSGG